jgi:perosamine synthetase
VIPYGRQSISAEDLEAVAATLQSDWLTTGPKVDEFERSVAAYTGARHALAVCNGTAALHCAAVAAGVGPGDEVIVPAITFVATANAAVFQNGIPVFADVDRDTLLIDPVSVESKITAKTKAIIAVDYAGQPCDYAALREIADRHNLKLVADASHSLGAASDQGKVGTLADLTTFSFHPVKPITTGEGGMIVTDDETMWRAMRRFRNHGIDNDSRQREEAGQWFYEMVSLGYNYRIPDILCALGISQLKKLDGWIRRRQAIAAQYDNALGAVSGVTPLVTSPAVSHGYHLYVIRVDAQRFGKSRDELFRTLRKRGIGVNVHYLPLNLHRFYRERFGAHAGQCPVAEQVFTELLSLPIYPGMSEQQVAEVIAAIQEEAISS